jgi:hypothetical protein
MGRFNPLKGFFKSQSPETLICIKRGKDRRLKNLGRLIDRRKTFDRRVSQENAKNYEYVGLNSGGWAKVDE